VPVATVLLLGSVEVAPLGTLGAGFAWLATGFGVAAWSRRPWPWLGALALAAAVNDLRSVRYEASDLLVETVFFAFTVWIGRMVARRVAQAEALAASLEVADAERVAVASQAVARERATIARELHDIVAHAVSLIVVQASTARPLAKRRDAELDDVLATIEEAGREALAELRRLLQVLRSEEADGSQPVPGLDTLATLVEGMRRAGVDVRTSLTLPAAVPPGVSLCAYRAVQEGLTNALRHAPGVPVEVAVMPAGQTLRISVRDFGTGAGAASTGSGTGLIGLRERVLLCGGRMTSGPVDGGFRLDVELPMTDFALPVEVHAPSNAAS
jgi:signal transduction histidine kinase